MKIAVCDDSREDRGALRALLEAYGHDFEIREYGSGTELYADMGYVRECGIVFLDINMEGMDGLEAAGKIKAECPKVHIVLVTAYVNYALDWYKVKASRFLLKDDLEQTLPECVEDILREERAVEFGFVEGNVRLRVDDIIYIETSKHKNVFYTVGEAYSIYKKMDELAAELAGMGFVRIHQSFLIKRHLTEPRFRIFILHITLRRAVLIPLHDLIVKVPICPYIVRSPVRKAVCAAVPLPFQLPGFLRQAVSITCLYGL